METTKILTYVALAIIILSIANLGIAFTGFAVTEDLGVVNVTIAPSARGYDLGARCPSIEGCTRHHKLIGIFTVQLTMLDKALDGPGVEDCDGQGSTLGPITPLRAL